MKCGSKPLILRSLVLYVMLMGLTKVDIVLEVEGLEEAVETVAVDVVVVMDLRGKAVTAMARR